MTSKPATQTQSTSQSRSPWSPTVAPLKEIVGDAMKIGNDVSNFQPITGQGTQAGIDMFGRAAQNVAQNGSAAQQAFGQVVPGSIDGFQTGLGQLQALAGGSYLHANPYLDPVVNKAMTDAASKVNSQFTAAGRYGSGAHSGALGRELGGIVAQANLSNYQTERANQDKAAQLLYGGGFQGAGMSGAADQAQLIPAQMQMQYGSMQDQIANQNRLAPLQALEWQSGLINPIAQQGGSSSGTTTSTMTQPTNPWAMGLGAAQMGLGLLAAPYTGGASLGMASGGMSQMGRGMGFF